MPKMRLPATSVKKHGKLSHYHGGWKIGCSAVRITKTVNGKMKWIRIGLWCPFCGFHPGENALQMKQLVLETILVGQPARVGEGLQTRGL